MHIRGRVIAILASVALMRKALKDFTFSDGTFIPQGTSLVSPSESVHHDDEIYENAHFFDPFRFFHMRDQEGGGGTKHHFASTSLEYLPFGHGKHAWYGVVHSLPSMRFTPRLISPGRFFAALELKSMLAHIITSYDVKLQNHSPRPQCWRIGPAIAADSSLKVMFRKRDV